MTTINMVKCLRCDIHWAKEDDDGICETCVPLLQVELVLADLTLSITQLTALDLSNLECAQLKSTVDWSINKLQEIKDGL